MNSYERVIKTLNHQKADRLPVDYVATPEFDRNIKKYLGLEKDEDLRRHLGVDIRRVKADYIGPEELNGESFYDPGKDFLGVVWEPKENEFGTYNEIAYHPLAEVRSVEEVEEYSWPDPDWYDESNLVKEIERINQDERYAIIFYTEGAYETPWYMRGLERFMMDLVECPEIAQAISRKAAEFYKERTIRAIEATDGMIDLIGSGGDIGTQRGMMISPDLWRKHIKPYSAELITPFKKMGYHTFYHSCGSIIPVMEDFIEIGLDIMSPIQPKAKGMDAENLNRLFGGRITFHGGLDEQYLLPNGTPQDIEAETRRIMDALGTSGGYIISAAHAIQPDTPVGNILAMYRTAGSLKS
jgi:uroporphyrinogen decarboxylase